MPDINLQDLFIYLETGSCYVDQLAWNSQSFCLSLPSPGVTGPAQQSFIWGAFVENHQWQLLPETVGVNTTG
jgi:hypothetical protein